MIFVKRRFSLRNNFLWYIKTMKVHRLSPEYLVEIGNRIKVVRTCLRYDQKQLARYLRTTQSQLSKIEAGKAEPGIYHLLMIKKLADSDENLRKKVTWVWLLDGKGRGPFSVRNDLRYRK